MKKDIEFPTVEGIKVAIARQKNELNEVEWHVYLLNQNRFDIQNILITSKGYGLKEESGEQQRTSTLRHMFEQIEAHSFVNIERIDPSVFHLCSEYWVSYYVGNKIYDKKFVFLPDSIREENITQINMLELEGILHS
ncbi:MAG: hypothetical protein EAZ55_09355 [Cytophagales bacterium]|nr:MAG: hypothetical protein EAZ55_09355 [Cytophagales bacterium]